MIIGVFTRHFKVYKNLNFIPVSDNLENNFSIYVGNNGVGKSSILEALDSFFNDVFWNRNKDGKKDEAFIMPFFLIERQKIILDLDLDENDQNVLSFISDQFWSLSSSNTSPELHDFVRIKDKLAKLYIPENFYLIGIGCTYQEQNSAFFSSSSANLTAIKSKVSTLYPDYALDKVLFIVRKFYSFIYIPVEYNVSEALALETFEMQRLMNKDILDAIDTTLKSKVFDGKQNVVNHINKSLNDFMDSINEQVMKIDSQYSYKTDHGYKKNLTPLDLREKILEAYFSVRTLKKDGKEIWQLSSGEQRMALIDIASAFLASGIETKRLGQIILAIDEPEASMHISKCFKQFKRLETLSENRDTQILLTSHWYGSLPTIGKGNLHHIEFNGKPVIKSFDFQNYLEEGRTFPDDIEMKSFFELVSTIISSIKNNQTNWLICEGSDDRKYLTHYLSNEIETEKLIILPVGGRGNVIKLYEYLYAPFTEKTEKKLLVGKVLCLIDSDLQQIRTTIGPGSDNNIKMVRLEQNKNTDTVSLPNLQATGNYNITKIEDCLNPDILFKALLSTINKVSSEEIKILFGRFERDVNRLNSRIEGENTLLTPKDVEAIGEKHKLYDEFKTGSFKYALACEYVEIASSSSHTRPSIIDQIRDFFNFDN